MEEPGYGRAGATYEHLRVVGGARVMEMPGGVEHSELDGHLH